MVPAESLVGARSLPLPTTTFEKTPNVAPQFKTLLQVNTRVWLNELRAVQLKPSLNLSAIDPSIFDKWKASGIDAVWLMGVWKPSEEGQKVARSLPDLTAKAKKILSDFKPEDIVSSPYAVAEYTPNPDLGDADVIRTMRDTLHRAGLLLFLDFVPNHTALDHPWVKEHPEYYVQGTAKDLKKDPSLWYAPACHKGNIIIARGKDPNLPAWTDTAQLNIAKKETRKALTLQIQRIADLCDGIRCDMAMLLLNDVFKKTWGEVAPDAVPKKPLPTEFWEEAISAVKKDHPNFHFMAEVYWDLEPQLIKLGFDSTYDKRILDLLLEGRGEDAVKSMVEKGDNAAKMVHFVENHDEARSVEAFGPSRSMAAALIMSTLPGISLMQEGQSEGRRAQVPVQLRRRPLEKRNRRLEFFYTKLLDALKNKVFRQGAFYPLELRPLEAHLSLSDGLIAYAREFGNERRLIIANVRRGQGRAYVRIPPKWVKGPTFRLVDELSGATEDIPADQIRNQGLMLDLATGGHRLWKVVGE